MRKIGGMKQLFVLLLLPIHFLVLVTDLQAQQEMLLYKGVPPGNLTNKNIEEFRQSGANRPTVTNVSIPSIYCYLPMGQPTGSAVIICPGGGYNRLSIVDGGKETAAAFSKKGVAAFVLKYRTWADSTFENYRDIPIQDLKQALQIIMANAKEWNIDTAKIGVLGFSAGGHLAAMSSTAKAGIKFAFNILVYPVISFTDSLQSPSTQTRKTLLGKNITAQDKIDYSPELHVSNQTPPTFIIHAQDDSTSLVSNSLIYYLKK